MNVVQKVRDFLNIKHEDIEAQEWAKQCQLTPDIWKLEQSMYNLIFVPDDMMRGRKNNHLIADAGYSGEVPVHPACFTLEKFTFFKKDLGDESYPIPFEKNYRPSGYLRVEPVPAKIKGQLYAILSPRIIKLDKHRQNGIQFRRTRQLIHLPWMEVKYSKDKPIPSISKTYVRTIEATMYVGIPEYWDDMIGDMFTIREVEQYELDQPEYWLDRFYQF